MNRICDLCKVDLGNQTEYNFNLHRNSKQCKAKQIKIPSKTPISSYFGVKSLKSSQIGNSIFNKCNY
jgi:hypothetical protein